MNDEKWEETREGTRDRLKGTQKSRQTEMTENECQRKRMLEAEQPETRE